MMTNTLHSFCLTSVTSPVKTSPSYVTCHHWSNSIWWLEVSTWFEVTESVTLPWKSLLIIAILTFPSINCMQFFSKIPITLLVHLQKLLSNLEPLLCFGDHWWTHSYNANIAFRCSIVETVCIGSGVTRSKTRESQKPRKSQKTQLNKVIPLCTTLKQRN